jgi:hypothetical protein
MNLFNNWNFKKHFSSSLVLSFCMGSIGYFLIDNFLINKVITKEIPGDLTSNSPIAYSSTTVHVFGSPFEIIISIGLLILIMLLLLYKPLKWGINKLSK